MAMTCIIDVGSAYKSFIVARPSYENAVLRDMDVVGTHPTFGADSSPMPDVNHEPGFKLVWPFNIP